MHRSNVKLVLKLLTLVKNMIPFIILAIIMGVLGYLCAIGITVFGGYALLNVSGANVDISINTAFIMIIIFAVLRGVLRYSEQASNHYIAFKLLAIIRDKIFSQLRKLAPAKLEGKDKGNLISLITSDIELLEVFYAHTISPVAIAFIVSVVMVIYLSFIHPLLGVIGAFGYITVGVIIPLIISKLGKSTGKEFRHKFGSLSSIVLDNLRGLKEILQYDCGEKRLNDMLDKTDELSGIQSKLKLYEGIGGAFTGAAILLFTILMLVSSTLLYQKGALNYDGVILSVIAIISSFGPVVALSSLSNNLLHTFAAGNRVLDILEEKPITKDIVDGSNIDFEGANFNNVDFSYDEEKILDKFSIDIPSSGIIGIKGKSGTGKSTVLKLLMRFWNADKGSITVSNNEIQTVNTDSLRDIQSYVTQETVLFDESIEDNIKIANLNASYEEVVEACKKASIHDFIISLPNGYKTKVGELGDRLSGGEKQRIGLARAFLHNAPLVLLDEPTSNLDSINEAVILKAINKNRDNKCFILVSHRPSSLAVADKVIEIQSKRVS